MGTFADAVDTFAGALGAVGIPATFDPHKVNPPCALIVPPDGERATAGGYFWAWTVWIVAPGPSDADAVGWLLEHLEDACTAVGAYTAEFDRLTVEPAAAPFPAYRLRVVATPL
jgi:hypothetical protein